MNFENKLNIDIPPLSEEKQKEKEEQQKERENRAKELIKQAISLNLPQIVIDSFKNTFTKYGIKTTDEILIERVISCYKEHNELINKLPQEIADDFIYEYCTYEDRKNEILNDYSYYKGYKDVFYLLHLNKVNIVYNGVCLQKDSTKYISDFSWGYIDLSNSDLFKEDKKISANTEQTAEVILSAIFPYNEEKLNLKQLFINTFLIENTISYTNSSFTKDDVLNWYNNLNLIKRACVELQLTYREFGEKVGFGEGAIKNAAATGKISDQLKRAIEMYLEIQKLTKENQKFREIQKLIKDITTI